MQEKPTSALPPRKKETSRSTLLVAFVSVTGIIAMLLLMEFGMSAIGTERDAPVMTFTPEDTHLHFHYFSNPKRRTIKTVGSIQQIPRDHRRMVIVTERGDEPLQSETVYIANLTEQFPSGAIRAHRLDIGQVLFALDMQSQARQEAIDRQGQMQMRTPTPMGAAPVDDYRRELKEIDTSKLDHMNLPANMPSPKKLQNCTQYQGNHSEMTRCMNQR